MKDFGNIIYRTETKAYVIRNNTYTVPHPDDETVSAEIHAEFDALYAEVDAYAKEHPDMVTEEHPYEPPASDVDSVRLQKLMELDYQQSHIAQAIIESEASEDFSSAKAYQTIYKHNASLYDVIAGAGSVDELNSITILAPVPETVWEMASALPIEETL